MKNQRPAFVSSAAARRALFCLTLIAFKLTLTGIHTLSAYSTDLAHAAQFAQTSAPARS